MKYYILKRNSKQLMNDYLADLTKEKRKQVEKRLNENEKLLLIEKTIVKDEIRHKRALYKPLDSWRRL